MCTVHVLHARRKPRNRDEGERITWRWRCCRGGQRLCCGGRKCFQRRRERDQRDVTVFIFFPVYLLFFGSLLFCPSVLWLFVFFCFVLAVAVLVEVANWGELSVAGGLFFSAFSSTSVSALSHVLSPFLCFVSVSPLLLLVEAVVCSAAGGGGIVVAEMRQAGGVCCSLFSSFPCRGAILCFSVISVFFFPPPLCFFFYFLTMMVLSGVTGRDGGFGGCGRRPRLRDKQREEQLLGTRKKDDFFLTLDPLILPPWSMKIKYIYRRWKRDTFYIRVQNISPWFDSKASQPSAQSWNDELSVLVRKIAGRVGHFGAVPPPLQP